MPKTSPVNTQISPLEIFLAQTEDLSIAVPTVIMRRMGATARGIEGLSARDNGFGIMDEKMAALTESWVATVGYAMELQAAARQSTIDRMCHWPEIFTSPLGLTSENDFIKYSYTMLNRALTPIVDRVVANAARLSS